jgi:hypothetical protein
MEKSIGILYLCTGPYKLFWKDFYDSFEKYFLTNINKHYYVFAEKFDQGLEKYIDDEKVTLIHIDAMPWPLITLLRFRYFLSIENLLKQHDYLMFSNANIICNNLVTADEFLPDESIGQEMSYCQHPGYWKTQIYNVPFDRNKKSNAYIPYNCGEHYVIGAMFAGKTEAFLRMSHVLNERIKDDLKKNIIARWHDESHLNRYIVGKENYKLLSPSYCYPFGFDLPVERKISAVSKQAKFDVKTFKGANESKIGFSLFFKKVLKRIKNEGSVWYLRDVVFFKKIKMI